MDKRVVVAPAWPLAVEHVGFNMRSSDWEECERTYGLFMSPADRLKLSVQASLKAWCAIDIAAHEPIAVFGVQSFALLGSVGAAWMIATPKVEAHPRAMLEIGRRYVDKMHEHFDTLVNYVIQGHSDSLCWLKHLGFEILPAAPYGAEKALFHQVIRHKGPARCVTQRC